MKTRTEPGIRFGTAPMVATAAPGIGSKTAKGSAIVLLCSFWFFAMGTGLFPSARVAAAAAPQFKIENPETGDQPGLAGNAVDLDGDSMIVGALRTDPFNVTDAGAAYVWRHTPDNGWMLEAELGTNQPAENDIFGVSVSISGDTAAVGASRDDDKGTDAGAAYFFVRSGSTWVRQTKLVALDGAADDQFGSVVVLQGDTMVVTAPRADDGALTDAGAVYIFTRSNLQWSQSQKLTADDAGFGAYFGTSAALDGDTLIIGAYLDDDPHSNSGSAYVYIRNNGVWTLQQKLTASDSVQGDQFGFSVSLSVDTAVIGATGADVGAPSTGAAYVFTRSNGVWTEQAKLTAEADAVAGDQFGWSVSISGDTAAIGAIYDDDRATDAGSVFVFTRSGTVWTRQQLLTDENGAAGDILGYAVAVQNDTLAAGAPFDDEGGTDTGSVFTFTRSGDVWTQEQKVVDASPAAENYFGQSVAVSGDTAIVGAPQILAPSEGTNPGAAYVFIRSGAGWILQQKLEAGDTQAEGRYFGKSVSIDGDTAVVGAPNDSQGARFSGAAYVFTRANGVWTQQAKLKALDVAALANLGESVSLSGDTLIAGAPLATVNGTRTGAAYFFIRSGTEWTQEVKQIASDRAASDLFGSSVSVSGTGDTVVVGAYQHSGAGNLSGAAYVFARVGGFWTEQAKLADFANLVAGDTFGRSVSISGNTVLVSDDGDDTMGFEAGATYVFVRAQGLWRRQNKIVNPDAVSSERFGYTVAISGDTAAIGVPFAGDAAPFSGKAFVYKRFNGIWLKVAQLTAADAAEQDWFSWSIAVEGSTVLVGAYQNDGPEYDSGAAYAFDLHAVLAQRIRDVLLGRSTDGEGLDLNDDSRIDSADLVLSFLN